MNEERLKYRNLVNNHPLKSLIRHIGPVLKMDNMVVLTVYFYVWDKNADAWLVRSGVSRCSPDDEFDLTTGKTVALYHALQQAQSTMKASYVNELSIS